MRGLSPTIEFLDARGELVARLGTYECVVDASLNQAFRRNQLGRALRYRVATEVSVSVHQIQPHAG